MEKFTVTISRQFGSLGRPIGMKLAELLNVDFYDRDIVEEAAKQMNLPISEVSKHEETEKSRFFNMRYPLGERSLEIKERVYEVQNKIILDWAQKSSCVIVGRCSDYILRNQENHISFFIYAPYEARLENCINDLSMKRSDAEKMIAEVDRARDAYHKRYTRFSQNDLAYHHVMIDSSLLGVDGTAEMVAEIVKKKFDLS